MLDDERARVAAAAGRLSEAGLVIGSAGNVSARSGELVAVSPTGAGLADLEAEQVAVVDLDGAQHAGPLAPTSELELHLGIYRRFDAGGVVHTHSPYATALACVLHELPVVHYALLALGGPVRVAPYATFGTPELAQATLTALEGRQAALMASHGAITHGGSVEQALEHARLLEWGAELYWRAAAIGTPHTLGAEEQRAVIDAVLARGYGRPRPRDPS